MLIIINNKFDENVLLSPIITYDVFYDTNR